MKIKIPKFQVLGVLCRVLGVLQNSLYVLYGLERVTEPTEVSGTVPDLLQKSQKFRVLYRKSYRSLCKNQVLCESRTNTRGYCAGSVTEPTEVPGIVLEVLQNLQKFRVLYRKSYRSLCKKSGLLETLYRAHNRYSVFFYRSTIPRVRVNTREIPEKYSGTGIP